jgi:hypothetical protein
MDLLLFYWYEHTFKKFETKQLHSLAPFFKKIENWQIANVTKLHIFVPPYIYVTKNVKSPHPLLLGIETEEFKRLPTGIYHKNLVTQKNFSWNLANLGHFFRWKVLYISWNHIFQVKISQKFTKKIKN